MMRLIFASRNNHKLREVREFFNHAGLTAIQIGELDEKLFPDELPEHQDTLEGNALEKARLVHSELHSDCFAEDTGLEVEALNNAPGVYSARFAGEGKSSSDNIQLLLEKLSGCKNRRARFRTVIALITGDQEFLFEGTVSGKIAASPVGASGFGYDPVFIPEKSTRTFAEMNGEEKNRISHRARALTAMAEFLVKEEIRQSSGGK